MNKKEKDWIFSKINTLKEIRDGINNTLEYTNIFFLCNAMILWIDNLIKEIHKKIGIEVN